MGFMIREIDTERTFSSALTVDALRRALPPDAITRAIAQEGVGEVRERRLTMALIVWLVIALHLYPTVSIGGVLAKLARGLRFIWTDPSIVLPTDSAIAYRRSQLGARPIVAVFKQVCQPIATAQTRGAWLFGLRAMAIDGTTEDVPDTPANAAAFGRHTSTRGASAFPQVQGVYLVECGTHVVTDAGFWPCHTSERRGGFRASGVKPLPLRTLPDGSVLAYLLPSEDARRRRGERILVRVVTYTITDPALVGYGEVHRVITTLLNPRLASALELVCGYHERWEIELVIDEIDTHQRLVGRTLRSLTPLGVIQELYGVLLAHYAVRTLMHEAALVADVDPDRLSFVHALEIVRDAVPEFQMVAPAQQRMLYERMLHDISTKQLPPRRPRSNARVVKRKMSNFLLKRPEHYQPPKPQGVFRDAVLIQVPPVVEVPPPQLGRARLELGQRVYILI